MYMNLKRLYVPQLFSNQDKIAESRNFKRGTRTISLCKSPKEVPV